ncbi:glycosyltransferase [Pseudonocardia sp. TRM90224]|uniref:glycosyltransferase n=1 Tax=Pseudonocardia sp. TRM90224 TaxID=2812678 RepID=UPI001E36140A|nr:glycosyltransferase [Pseudonocardia sp. TRM90224]
MRILLLTAGSRGDVEPFLALARRAVLEGHDVRLGVTAEFVDTVRAAGIEPAPLAGDYSELVAEQGVSPLAAIRSFRTTIVPMMTALLRSAARAATDHRPDVIVHHPKVLSAPLAATALGIPHVLCEIVPVVTPTRSFPAAGVTTVDLGPLNRLTYRATGAANRMFAGPLREVGGGLGLRPGAAVAPSARSLVPISPALLTRPADWPASTVITGAWHQPGTEPEVDAELAEFLAEGDVVHAGFGSMAAGDPVARGRAVVGAIRAVGKRALVTTGWGGMDVPGDLLGPDVLVRSAVPHGRVLPLCRAAVHHGGAGTVHAVVRAGLPSVVVPFLADQPFWGKLLHRRGLAAAPLPARKLTEQRLAAALAALPPAAVVQRVAAEMAMEDGCAAALKELAAL